TIAPKTLLSVETGRMIEHTGRLGSRNGHGSGMIRLVWKSSPPNGGLLRSGKVSPVLGSVRGGALPALSCHVSKCMGSLAPILSRIRKTSRLETFRASVG